MPKPPPRRLSDQDLMVMADTAGLNVYPDPEPDMDDPDHDLLHYWAHGQIADGALLTFARAIEHYHNIGRNPS